MKKSIFLVLVFHATVNYAMLAPVVRSSLRVASRVAWHTKAFAAGWMLINARTLGTEAASLKDKISAWAAENKSLQSVRQWYHEKFKVNATQTSSTVEGSLHGQQPGQHLTAQAAKTEAEQNATVSGILNFPKNTTNNYTTINHNHHYATEGWASNFFKWLKEGGQNRAAGVGFAAGGVAGYATHAGLSKPEKQEKVIIVQASPITSEETLKKH